MTSTISPSIEEDFEKSKSYLLGKIDTMFQQEIKESLSLLGSIVSVRPNFQHSWIELVARNMKEGSVDSKMCALQVAYSNLTPYSMCYLKCHSGWPTQLNKNKGLAFFSLWIDRGWIDLDMDQSCRFPWGHLDRNLQEKKYTDGNMH